MTEKEKKQVKFIGKIRDASGKGSSRSLRRSGFIPAILYGAEEQNKLLSIEKKSAEINFRHVSSHNIMADLIIDEGNTNTTLKTIVKEVQTNPITGEILHMDFYHIGSNQPVSLSIPVRLVGECPGVKEGGILEHDLREIPVEGLPDLLPENIDIDVSELKMGESIYVKDIKVSDGVRILLEPEHTIVTVLAPKVEVEAAPAEEAAAPTVSEEAQQPKVITQEIAEERRKEKESKKETEKGS